MEKNTVLVSIAEEDWKEIVRLHNEAHNYIVTRNILDRMVTKVLKDDSKDLMDEGDCISLVYALTSLLIANETEDRVITEIVADTPEELQQKLEQFFSEEPVISLNDSNSLKLNEFFYNFLSLLPSWVNYIAMDESGEVWVFEHMPIATQDNTWDSPTGEFDTLGNLINWKATLTKVNK